MICRATEARQPDIVKLILSTDSGKNTLSRPKESTKETPLIVACKLGFDEIVECIMENSDKVIKLDQTDKNGKTVFHHAAKHDEILSVMIDTCSRMVCTLVTTGFEPLFFAFLHFHVISLHWACILNYF